ncbi:MAG: hypothetical protein ACTSQD_05380 [Promethearchaeota archaeon]
MIIEKLIIQCSIYPSIHGVRCNGINLNPEQPTFVDSLRKRGYHTCSFG